MSCVPTGWTGRGSRRARSKGYAGLRDHRWLAGTGAVAGRGNGAGRTSRRTGSRVYCLLSDGELQEGQVWEAFMSAGHHGLDNLVVLVDNNRMQADGATADVMTVEPVPEKLEAFGFAALRLDANSIDEVLDGLPGRRSSGAGRPGSSATTCRAGVSPASRYTRRCTTSAPQMRCGRRRWRNSVEPHRSRHRPTHAVALPSTAHPRSSPSGSTTTTTPRSRRWRCPNAPLLFAKWPNALIGDREPIRLPRESTQVDYEAELGVVIGRMVKGPVPVRRARSTSSRGTSAPTT